MKVLFLKRHKNALTYLFLGLILFILYLYQNVNTLPSPLGLIPAIVVVYVAVCGSIMGEYVGCVMGFMGGLLCDVSAPLSYCFNLVVLTAIGIACGFLGTRLFTRRFVCTLTLSFLALVVYFILQWLVVGVIFGNEGFYYLLRYSLPSVLYSLLYVLPVYPLVSIINKRIS
ncbi:MAG: hypothetical protein IJ944_04865 [Clostridia bacterium]|nr:hypothetical protein [Clostridia bacterium]